LITDTRKGLSYRSFFSCDFDWDNRMPVGKELSDRAIRKRETEGTAIFKCYYQQVLDGNSLAEEWLMAVLRFEGRDLKEIIEYRDDKLVLRMKIEAFVHPAALSDPIPLF
jgi:hypothetical protein